MEQLSGLDSFGTYTRRAMQTAFSSTYDFAREKQKVHFWNHRFGRRANALYQSGFGTFLSGPVELQTGDYTFYFEINLK